MKYLRIKIDKYEVNGNIILRDIDFILNENDSVALVGGNGVGKSTLLKTIMGQIEILDGIFTKGKGVKIIYYSQLHEELQKEKTIRKNFLHHGIYLMNQLKWIWC